MTQIYTNDMIIVFVYL